MKLHHVDFPDTHTFSDSFLDYISGKATLKPFYHRAPEISNFKQQLEEKANSFSTATRNQLVASLQKQYDKVEVSETVKNNITSLNDSRTFTITTGHQLNIFTGPLYFIYKIVTVVNTCKILKQQYPEYNFVPVYWMASEDHDYDEIKSFQLYGKKYTWECDERGAVGRFSTASLKKLLNEVPGDINLFKEAYTKYGTLAQAVRCYVNELFGESGVIVIDGDDRDLKKILAPVIEDDLFNHASKKLVENTNAQLEKAGYKTQIYARDINFFYLDSDLRTRLEKIEDRFAAVDTTLSFTATEIKKLIQDEPEKFSPNVVLRPLYQEMILPNLAYTGGPAEVVYWLQLKSVFDHYKIPFPILLPRNFALIIDAVTNRKFEKTGLIVADLFLEKNYLFNHFIIKHSRDKVKLNGEKEAIERYFETIKKQAESVDTTLAPFVGAEARRAIKSLEKIEQKMLRAEKRFQSDKLRQIEAVKDALFPNGNLQERTDNFLNFYQQDKNFIHSLLQQFNPFDFRLHVLVYND